MLKLASFSKDKFQHSISFWKLIPNLLMNNPAASGGVSKLANNIFSQQLREIKPTIAGLNILSAINLNDFAGYMPG